MVEEGPATQPGADASTEREPASPATPNADFTTRHEQALKRCNDEITRNERDRNRSALFQHGLQALAVALSGLTAILILWSDLPHPLQALPASLASIIAGIVAIFRWHDNYIRSAYTAEALQSEMEKYRTRAAPYRITLPADEALNTFVTKVEAIIMTAAGQWLTAHSQTSDQTK